jgi:hypothetical protein
MIGYDHACDRAQVAFYRLQGSFVQRIMVCGRESKIAGRKQGNVSDDGLLQEA